MFTTNKGDLVVCGGLDKSNINNLLSDEEDDEEEEEWLLNDEVLLESCFITQSNGNSYPVSRMHCPHANGTGVSLQDGNVTHLIICGGRSDDPADICDVSSLCETWNSRDQQWQVIRPMPHSRKGTQATIWKNQVVIVGGCTESGWSSSAVSLNIDFKAPCTEWKWTELSSIPSERCEFGFAAHSVNNSLYVITSATPGTEQYGIYRYNEIENTWCSSRTFSKRVLQQQSSTVFTANVLFFDGSSPSAA
jgi:prepilin-type processing-associated H-X9-DG protein